MNWVDRRARRERLLSEGGPEVWQQVRAALQDACESYTRHYDQLQRQLRCELENGIRLRITHGRTTILVAFVQELPAIVSAANQGKLIFTIDADEDSAFVEHQGRRITPDEISELILKDLLFPATSARRADSPASGPGGWMS